MLGLRHGEIRLEPYDESWELLFVREKEKLKNVPDMLEIYHVGSTAVRGALAKPIIDLAVSCRDLSVLDISAIEALGYIYRGETGIEGRKYFLRKNGEFTTHHMHCYDKGHPALWNLLLFRDYLNAHPEQVTVYSQLKLSLMNSGLSHEDYTEAKTEFIQFIIGLAKGVTS